MSLYIVDIHGELEGDYEIIKKYEEPTTKNNLGVQMTNGEKMISAFPDGEVRKCEKGVVFSTGGWCHAYADEWWNAEYKEPTTKNNLGVQMTNGEKLKEIFPNGVLTSGGNNSYYWGDDILVSKEWWNAEYKEPTTKNDLPHCQYTDEEIAKSFIEDVEAVKDQLPCGQMMDFPNTFDEFAKDYGFKDKKEIYTNGSELIPVFRVRQWLEHISTTKNDLGVDCIDRADAIKAMQNKAKELKNEDTINGLCGAVAMLYEMPSVTTQPCDTCRHYENSCHWLPSVTPKEPQTFKWCTDCKEYDQEKHCCHRWSKVIRDTVEEMKQEQEPKTGHWIDNECTNCGYEVQPWNNTNYCPNCGAKMESEVDNGNNN